MASAGMLVNRDPGQKVQRTGLQSATLHRPHAFEG
jgi:hypothetical protein